MSTILEALRQLEGGEAPTPEARDRSRALRWVAGGLLVVTLVAVAAVIGLLRRQPQAPTAESTASKPVQPERVQPPAALAPRIQTRPAEEPPQARVGKMAPPTVAVERPSPPPRVVERPPPPRAAEPRPSAVMGGTPHLDITAIRYSPVGTQRSVTLRIDGGSAVTLREGESANGIEVQLIMERSVYVRHGGNVFAVDAER